MDEGTTSSQGTGSEPLRPALSRRRLLGASASGLTLALLAPGLGSGANAFAATAGAAASTPAGVGGIGAAPVIIPDALAGVFVGERVGRFTVQTAADTVRWTIRTLWGDTVGSGTARVSGRRACLALPVRDPGYYTLQVTAVTKGTAAGTAQTSFALLDPYRAPADSPFGANTHLQPPSMVPLMSALGIGWARMDLTWEDIEPPALAGWSPEVYQAAATVELDSTVAHTGQSSVKIVNQSPIQANYFATIAQQITVEPNTTYTFSAWVKGENVAPSALQFTIADDWGSRTDAPSGTFDWTKVSFQYTTTSQTSLTFRLLSSDVTPAGWMDDATVTAAGSTVNLLVNPGFEQGLVSGYTFATFEPYVDALLQAHINPLPILDYANAKYDGGQTPYDDAGRTAFANYAAAAIGHWRGRFRAVEVYNEYNAGWFTTGPASADPGYYAKLLAATYPAVKGADPGVTVVGGVTYGFDLDWLTAVFEAGGMGNLDAISNHPYTGAPESGTPIDVGEQQVTALIEQYNGGKAKPVWISELGWSLPNELTTAGYLVRGLVLALAGGVERFFWYDLVGDQSFGLLDQDGDAYSPRPAFAAYAAAIRLLSGAVLSGGGQLGSSGIRAYRFAGPDHDDTAVLWSTDPRDAVAIPTSTPITLVDVTGTPTTLTPYQGAVHLTLTGTPVYLRGPGLASRTNLVQANSGIDVSAPALTRTSDGTVELTYILDNTAGSQPVTLTYTTADTPTRVRAAAGATAQVAAAIPVSALQAGQNTLITSVSDGSALVGRLVSSLVVVDVPADPVATIGTVDWTDAEFALAPGGYGQYPAQFPNDVQFTVGTSDPATAWPYIHPGPDDGWAGGRVHTFTVALSLDTVPADGLQLVVFLLDTHNTAPGTVVVGLNGNAGTTVSLPVGGGSGYASGSAFGSGDQPSQFSVPLPAAQLVAGPNTVTITKSTGSWMVYDAIGVYGS
jgi:Polysaccharide lyase family 4, domain III/Carbohydrate binding domain